MIMKKNKLFFFVLGILSIAVVSYISNVVFFNNSVGNESQSKKLQVSASFYPLYYFSSQIGGDKAYVQNITPAGAEPHDYDPSTQDIARIENGNMVVLNGGVESWGAKIKDNLRGKDITIVVAGEGLFSKELTNKGKQIRDPHVWLNPVLAKQEVAKITKGYIKADSKNAAYYKNNEKKLADKLDQLNALYNNALKNCKQKNVITSHAAFAYLAEAYGLNQVAISGFSPDEEPSAKQLVEVANFAKKNNVKYIFFESLSPKLSETVATEIGALTMVLDPIEGISDDGIKQGKNYFTVMEDNLKNLKTALECK